MARKNVVKQSYLVKNQSLGASFSSEPFETTFADNIDIFTNWSGSGVTGTLKVQVTNDDVHNQNITPVWNDLNISPPISINTNTGEDVISIRNVPGIFLRIQYNRTAGTGTFSASVTVRQLGG
jgi:hypothetical protein